MWYFLPLQVMKSKWMLKIQNLLFLTDAACLFAAFSSAGDAGPSLVLVS